MFHSWESAEVNVLHCKSTFNLHIFKIHVLYGTKQFKSNLTGKSCRGIHLGIYDLKKFRSKSQQLNIYISWDVFWVRKGTLKLNRHPSSDSVLSFSSYFTRECLFFCRCTSVWKKMCEQCSLSRVSFHLCQFLRQPIAAIIFLLVLNMSCLNKLGRWGFPFFFFPLCFLEEKLVKIFRYTLSSVQTVWTNILPSQQCGLNSPRLPGQWQQTVLQSNRLFFPYLGLSRFP